MKILLIHADHIDYEVKEKAIKAPEEVPDDRKKDSMDEALVVFCTVEKPDEKDPVQVAEKTAEAIEEVAKSVKASNILLYPYAHLSSNLGSPAIAIPLLKKIEDELKSRNYSVKRSPFGYYKSFNIKCKGHPLSELSRSITVELEKAKPPTVPIKTIYKVFTLDGELVDPEEYVKKSEPSEFKSLVEKEALKKGLTGGGEPLYLKYCKKFGIEWEPYSDLGHMRYGPEATLIFDLIGDYAAQLVNSLEIPVFHVRGTNLFDLSVPAVKEHADLFGDRLYEIKLNEENYVLRYAACHQQFAMIKDWVISYKDLPFGAYELADSYRLEQEGELLLCFRVRKLHMPDLHIFCKDLNEAQKYALKVHGKIYEEIKKLNRDYVSIYNTTEKYFNQNRDFFKELLKIEKKPALINFVPEKYYWVINIEYNIIDQLDRPREIGTFQIDTGNAKRFGITYTDEKNEKKYPLIIHTALIGTVERYLFAILDTAAKAEKSGKPPALPIWLAPTQVRIIPVSNDQLGEAEKIMEKLSSSNIRADIDDCEETLPKKIRKAEVNWIPYTAVVGKKEVESGLLSVRVREKNQQKQFTINDLIKEIKEKTRGYPWRSLNLPKYLSQRPVYKSE